MAYNSNKGPQHSGDIQYEGDPNDVQIDFENDQIILRTGGAPRVNVTNSEISGSGVFRIAGAISGSGDMAITGAIHATEYYGDGSNLTGIAGAASGSARLYSSTGIETSGYLKVSGSSILSGAISGSSGVHISGSMPKLAIGSNTATTLQSGMLTIRPDDTNNRVLMMIQRTEASDNRIVLAATGSSQVIVGGAHLGGVFNISGSDIETLMSIKADAGEMLSVSALNCLSGAGVARLETVSASADVYVTGAVKANVFFGDGSNLTGISSGDVSGSARVYSVTGLETSGYLKVSGSTTLGGTLSSSATISSVGSISSSTDIAVTGAIHAANFYGDGSGLTNLPAGSVSGSVRHYSSVGLETSGYLKVSGSATLGGPTSISAPLTLAAPLSSSATISSVGSISSSADLAVSGNIHASAYYGDGSGLTNLPAGSVSGSARHYSTTGLETSGYLKVSGSSTLNAVTATTYSGSSTLQTVGNALFGGTIGASGSVTLKVDEPTIHFSSSTANLGTIGFNSSNNILIQNNFTNKHIVFKANDNGTLREGFRIDGAIPEVVVNQGSDSLIDFRVESDNNANMLYVQGSTDKVGINTSAPAETFSVVGNISGSGTLAISWLHLILSRYSMSLVPSTQTHTTVMAQTSRVSVAAALCPVHREFTVALA